MCVCVCVCVLFFLRRQALSLLSCSLTLSCNKYCKNCRDRYLRSCYVPSGKCLVLNEQMSSQCNTSSLVRATPHCFRLLIPSAFSLYMCDVLKRVLIQEVHLHALQFVCIVLFQLVECRLCVASSPPPPLPLPLPFPSPSPPLPPPLFHSYFLQRLPDIPNESLDEKKLIGYAQISRIPQNPKP